MSRFVGYLKTHIALEVHRALGTSGPFWGPRFSHSSVGDTSADVVRRLRYLLRNGCKENLVGSPLDWPGVSSARALCDGETELHGTWFNRTKEDKEWRKHGERGKRKRFPSVERVTLSPLPFLADSSPSERRHYIRALVQEIENETRARHRRDGTTPMGVVEVLRQDPLASPKDFQPTHPLRFLTSSRRELTKMRYAREQKEIAYSVAAEKLDRCENDFHFPEDCFPPGLPFVPRHAAAQPP